jgi:hypothetical protein
LIPVFASNKVKMLKRGEKARRLQWLHGANTNLPTNPKPNTIRLRPLSYLMCTGDDSLKFTLQSALHTVAVKAIFLTHGMKIFIPFSFLKDA